MAERRSGLEEINTRLRIRRGQLGAARTGRKRHAARGLAKPDDGTTRKTATRPIRSATLLKDNAFRLVDLVVTGTEVRKTQMDAPAAQGRSFPLGATLCDGGVNFSVFSKHNTGVELCLFDRVDDARAARVISLDPRTHRTYHYWHVFVPGISPGQLYAYRVHGLHDPANGLRFDASKTLLDPYGRCVARPAAYRRAADRPGPG